MIPMSAAPGGCRWRGARRLIVRCSISGPNPVAKGNVVATPHPAVDRQIQRHLWASNGAKIDGKAGVRAPASPPHAMARTDEDSDPPRLAIKSQSTASCARHSAIRRYKDLEVLPIPR